MHPGYFMEVLFHLKNLSCSYTGRESDKVLYIPELIIPRGKIVFLLGASGTGKSTILETLGLMNNTICGGSLYFYTQPSASPIEYSQLWNLKDELNIAAVRKDHFSFIFQNTNLMENFTAYENICLSDMIKQNISQKLATEEAKKLMIKVSLPEKEVNETTLAINLSGGQRQRLAFVRALNTKFTVLFGDEPTGNLDEENGNDLFEVIKSNLEKDLSAIIVSHDINLALRHADQIIVITRKDEINYGEIDPQNIFFSKDWKFLEKQGYDAFRERIKKLYRSEGDHHQISANGIEKIKYSKSYTSLFFKRESKMLLGKRLINFLILTSILFFTFLSIGFANGILNYLDEMMNSAFVNWITINIPWKLSGQQYINDLQDEFDDPNLKLKYNYSEVTPFMELPLFVVDHKTLNNDSPRYNLVEGRSIDIRDDRKLLMEDILSEDNRIQGNKSSFRENDLSVIVTQQLLRENNYPPDADYIYVEKLVIDEATDNQVSLSVPIPVKAIVKQLPGTNQIVYSIYFRQALKITFDNPFDIRKETSTLNFFIKSDKNNAKKIADRIGKFIVDSYPKYSPIANPLHNHTESFSPGQDLLISFFPPLESSQLADTIFKQCLELPDAKRYRDDIMRTFDYSDIKGNLPEVNYDELSVYFSNLDHIREFQAYMNLRKHSANDTDQVLQLDNTLVEQKEKFNFLSKITWIISYLVVLFGAVAVCLYLFNLLRMHLNKVKMNIGTFKAIGLNNRTSRNIYFAIILVFITTATVLALLLACGVGSVSDQLLKSNVVVAQKTSYFSLLDVKTIWTIVFIFISSIVVSWLTINSILSRSPGDLIYNR